MIFSPALIFLFIGHILGDFYFQTNKMAQKAEEKFPFVLLHSLFYALCMCAVLFIGIPATKDIWLVCILTSGSHLLIDAIKYVFLHLPWKKHPKPRPITVLLADQCFHGIMIFCIWRFFGSTLALRDIFTRQPAQLPALPIAIALGLLCILRPVGIAIRKYGLGSLNTKEEPAPASAAPDEAMATSDRFIRNSGRIIGYLERTIVFLFLLYGQYCAIAFVLTAKSIARFKELEQERMTAEYYLVGTLISVVSAFLVCFVLGLCKV